MKPTRFLVAATALFVIACGDDAAAPPVPTAVALNEQTATLVPGQTLTLQATVRDETGAVIEGAGVTWTSTNSAVASVAGGLVTANAPGTADVIAHSGAVSGRATVTVRTGGLVSPTGATIATPNATVLLGIPAGALPVGTSITLDPATDPSGNEHVVAGTIHEFSGAGAALSQPAVLQMKYDEGAVAAEAPEAALRIAAFRNGSWQIIAEGASVDSAANTVRASVTSLGRFAVVRDACVIAPLPTGVTVGRISRNDCLYTPVAGRRSDYYSVHAPAGQVIVVETSGALDGPIGVKEATTDPTTGRVFDSFTIRSTLRMLSNGQPLQLFISGKDSLTFGEYTLNHHVAPLAHSCNDRVTLIAPASFTQNLTAANSCSVTITHSPFPEAIGQPILTHLYSVRLFAGQTYTFTLAGLTPGFQAGLTLWGGTMASVLRQSVGGPVTTARSFTYTATDTRYVVIEVSSGYPIDGVWQTPAGSYTLSVQ